MGLHNLYEKYENEYSHVGLEGCYGILGGLQRAIVSGVAAIRVSSSTESEESCMTRNLFRSEVSQNGGVPSGIGFGDIIDNEFGQQLIRIVNARSTDRGFTLCDPAIEVLSVDSKSSGGSSHNLFRGNRNPQKTINGLDVTNRIHTDTKALLIIHGDIGIASRNQNSEGIVGSLRDIVLLEFHNPLPAERCRNLLVGNSTHFHQLLGSLLVSGQDRNFIQNSDITNDDYFNKKYKESEIIKDALGFAGWN